MRVLIVHDRVDESSSVDAADALVQARLISEHLRGQGHNVRTLGATLDLGAVTDELASCDLVVNLVESLDGKGSLIHLVPAVIEAAGCPMTGCPWPPSPTPPTNSPPSARCAHDIATPDWIEAGDDAPNAGRWIVKSVWEHASIGIGQHSVVDASSCDVAERMESMRDSLGGAALAERFIDGREFNLSMLEIDGAPVVLPPAEIRFVGYDDDRPKIVDYAAKWDESSHAYHNTPRVFEFDARDAPLLTRLRSICMQCWDVFGLRGYARVDFRVDEDATPWVLEVNSNPCLSPDAGFMAAAERHGLSCAEVIDHLVAAALATRRGAPASRAR
ncbi:MAG: hypothetical protein R3B46_01540 [Phycisphaerales bacterium]